MTLREVQTLLDYHYWARDRVLDACQALSPEQFAQPAVTSFGSVRDTLAHIYGADLVWYSRWTGASPAGLPEASAFPDVPSLRQAWAALEAQVRALVAGLGEKGVQAPVEYKTFDGRANTQPFWQLAQHVVNHGSYHRGQVTTLLRQLGAAPPKSMDLIAYHRERSGA